MRQRRPLYRRVAGIEPNSLLQSDPGSAQRLWRNLPSSSGIARVPASVKTTPTRVSDFLGFNATGTYLIPLRSWHRAQQPPAIGSRIGAMVVEKSAIEFWDRQGIYIVKTTLTRVSDFLSIDATETYLIPLRSWRRARQSPAIGFTIGEAVVEGSAIEV